MTGRRQWARCVDLTTVLVLPASGIGEEGGPVPEAHDGQAGQLRLPVRHLPRPLPRHHRDRHPAAIREGAHVPAARGGLERGGHARAGGERLISLSR